MFQKGGDSMENEASAKKAFERIYGETYDYIYRFLLIKSDSREELEDILQSVYLGFYNKLLRDGAGSVRDPKHYLLRSAKTALAGHFRSIKPAESLEDSTREIVDERALRELEQEDRFTAEQLMENVRAMDETTYKIFVLHFSYDLTLKKTAELLGLREATVKSRLYRALRQLKKNYEEGERHENY